MSMILTFDEFLKIENPQEAQQKFIEIVKELSDAKLAEHWSLPEYKIKTIRQSLGVQKNRKGEITETLKEIIWNPDNYKQPPRSKNMQQPKVNKNIKYIYETKLFATLTGQQLFDRLDALKNMPVVSPDNLFEIEITIREISSK